MRSGNPVSSHLLRDDEESVIGEIRYNQANLPRVQGSMLLFCPKMLEILTQYALNVWTKIITALVFRIK
jgi:hypothetical protein